MAKFNIKKNDTVIVLAGEDKGKTGKVLKVMAEQERQAKCQESSGRLCEDGGSYSHLKY